MIKSMTGYGRREAAESGSVVGVEVRSVNHRYAEILVRAPKHLGVLEEELKRLVQRGIGRGRVELTVNVSGGKEAGKSLSLDRPLARQYHRLLLDLQRELGLGGKVDVSLLAGFRDIVSMSDRPPDTAKLARTVKKLATAALGDLDRMRRKEGAALERDTRDRLKTVRDLVSGVERRAPAVVEESFERMKTRVEKLLGGEAPDRARLNQELAMFADRGDVTEEITRLGSHLSQFDAALKSREPVGRTLDFLLQEMGREVNTIGSKANDAAISADVVRLKGELEKIREQVQNIE